MNQPRHYELDERVMLLDRDMTTGRVVGHAFGVDVYDVRLDDGRVIRNTPHNHLRRLS